MLLCIENLLDVATLAAINEAIAAESAMFKDGGSTAGWHAKDVKHNLQAEGKTASVIIEKTNSAILAHPLVRAAAVPSTIVRTLISRYQPGMAYGSHVDEAVMNGQRTDVSFTLFLSAPHSYEGGELIIEGNDGETPIKLAAGSMVLYPSTSLHRVAPVIGGERLVIVGWIKSLVRSAEDREILFDLENTIASARNADRAMLDRLLKLRANLMRKWVD